MVLSEDGDPPMTRLSDTQLVILSAAAQRADLSVLPLPDSLTLKGGALKKVMDSLRNRGLIRVLGGDGGPERVVITSEGMAAIGVEPEGEEVSTGTETDARSPDTAPTLVEADKTAEAPAVATDADGAAMPAKSRRAKGKGTATARAASEPGTSGGEPAAEPTPRAGTKQARMIDLLKRPEGATVEQIAAATGWRHHTIRGAISGALKKRLGLTVHAIRIREVGPDKTGARGSATVYRIPGPDTSSEPVNGSSTGTA
ncbi:MAG TPA: DUF3489 domain-containing protein [Geminicoccaceae bacterium]|nr:DUF3489 domain-containing protein [Geminicoccaceae bacterium]